MRFSIDFIGFPKGWKKPNNLNLEVYKYFPDCFYKQKRIKEQNFSLDIFDLSYSTARTLCSYHLTERELYFDIIASMLSHLNFIDNSSNDFLLSESRYKRLRDFSKTTRIGEMAQGTNAFFVAKQLNYPYIIDFDLAKDQTFVNLNIQTSGRSPDFVIINKDLNKIGLFESKGTMGGIVSGKNGFLSDAMEQIDAVEQPCFDSSIPVCTKFSHNNNFNQLKNYRNTPSSINYALIERECTDSIDLKKLFKLHYASWFYLVGDFDRVNSLLEEGSIAAIANQDDIYDLDDETDKGNPIYWVKTPFRNIFSTINSELSIFIGISTFFKKSSDFKIGIYKKIIDNLLSSSNSEFTIPDSNISYLRKYPDGTLLFIRNNS